MNTIIAYHGTSTKDIFEILKKGFEVSSQKDPKTEVYETLNKYIYVEKLPEIVLNENNLDSPLFGMHNQILRNKAGRGIFCTVNTEDEDAAKTASYHAIQRTMRGCDSFEYHLISKLKSLTRIIQTYNAPTFSRLMAKFVLAAIKPEHKHNNQVEIQTEEQTHLPIVLKIKCSRREVCCSRFIKSVSPDQIVGIAFVDTSKTPQNMLNFNNIKEPEFLSISEFLKILNAMETPKKVATQRITPPLQQKQNINE